MTKKIFPSSGLSRVTLPVSTTCVPQAAAKALLKNVLFAADPLEYWYSIAVAVEPMMVLSEEVIFLE